MPEKTAFAPIMRLIWIDATLELRRTLNRADICAAFFVSPVQASIDLRLFQRTYPVRALYDRRWKVYRPAPGVGPVFEAWQHSAVRQAVGAVHETSWMINA